MVSQRLAEAIARALGVEPQLEVRVTDDLGADSLDVTMLITTIEDEFGIDISAEDVSALTTVQSISDSLRRDWPQRRTSSHRLSLWMACTSHKAPV